MVLSTTWKLVAQTVRKSMTGFSCRCAEKERLSRRRHRLSICIKCFISSCHGDMATLHDRISQTFSSEHKTLICGFGVSSIKRVSSFCLILCLHETLSWLFFTELHNFIGDVWFGEGQVICKMWGEKKIFCLCTTIKL